MVAALAAPPPPPPPPMTAKEAVRQAKADGLTLQKSDNNSGYKGIRKSSSRKRKKLYEATETRGGKTKFLGYYATAEEAAVCRAGLLDWEGVESFFTT